MYIDFDIENQKMRRTDNNILAANSLNAIKARFNFDESWNQLYKKAIFEYKGKALRIALENDECIIPFEVLSEGFFDIGIIATKADSDVFRATSNTVSVEVVKGPSVEAENAAEPVPLEIERIEAIAQSVRNDADEGKFNGKDASVEIGKIVTLDAGSKATVINSGSATNVILDFGIPKGDAGHSLHIASSVEQIKELCIKHAYSTSNLLFFIWLGDNSYITVMNGTKNTLITGNTYQLVYAKQGSSLILYSSLTQIAGLQVYGNTFALYKEALNNISRFHRSDCINGHETNDTNSIDVFLFAGDSNSIGRALYEDIKNPLDKFVLIDETKAFSFNNGASTVPVKISEPIEENNAQGIYYGYIPAFLNAYYAAANRCSCACYASSPGAVLDDFLPYTTDEEGNISEQASVMYIKMKESIENTRELLITNGYTIGHIFLVWCQGEADAAEDISDEEKEKKYIKNFCEMLDSVKVDCGIEKAFILRIGHSAGSQSLGNRPIISAQTSLCTENNDCVMVSSIFAGAKTFMDEEGTKRNLMTDNGYSPEAYLRAGLEAGVNTAIYVNSNFSIKPVLLEYHTLYLESLGEIDERIYERECDRYLYDPRRIDIGYMLGFSDSL